MTQQMSILHYLQEGKSITALEAMQMFRCMRLAAVVKDLRNQGYDISTTIVKGVGLKHYARYRLNQQ